MARASLLLLAGVAVTGILVPGIKATSWSFSPPANCPHEDPETHVCSSLFNSTVSEVFIGCCYQDEDGVWRMGEEEEEEEEEWDSKEEIAEAEGHHTCEKRCLAVRKVTYYSCFTHCCEGYQRSLNGTCQSKELNAECKNGGTLTTMGQFRYCKCRPGFYGRTCEEVACMCNNGGVCTVKNNEAVCMCPSGFYGKYCETPTCSLTCHNGGKCVSNGREEICNCTLPYVGKFCETKHIDSPKCPATPSGRDFAEDCHFYCNDDIDCYGSAICCSDGCSLVCRQPQSATCHYDGVTLAFGQSYSPKPCMNCTCIEGGDTRCTSTTRCPQMMCMGGLAPVQRPGHCCPICPDPPMEPPKITCPRYPVTIEVASKTVRLTKENTDVEASNSRGIQLPVYFEPATLDHCACPRSRIHYQTVTAYTHGDYSGEAKCQLDIYLKDATPPEFNSCPENIYLFEGERADWKEPILTDNVGIAKKSCTRSLKGQLLARGTYSVSYMAWDYEGNMGVCRFNITVSQQGTPFEQLPQGQRERAHAKSEEFKYALVIGPVVGAVGLFALILALCLCLRMKRRQTLAGHPTRNYHPGQNYDNNIYHLPCDVKLTPPPYSLPDNPPEYSSTLDLKEGEYTEIAPPTYTESVTKQSESYVNPGYETLGRKSEI